MFTDKLEIGIKGFAVEVPVQLATTVADCQTIARGSDDYVVACFNRAHRINVQERSGARDTVRKLTAGKSSSMLKDETFVASVIKTVTDVIAKWVPGARRAPTQVTPTLKLEAKGKTISLEQLLAAAKAQGINLEVSE